MKIEKNNNFGKNEDTNSELEFDPAHITPCLSAIRKLVYFSSLCQHVAFPVILQGHNSF